VSVSNETKAVIQRVREGDILWVRMGQDNDRKSIDAFRDDLLELMPEGTTLVITEHDVVEHMAVASLSDLLSIRQMIDRAIEKKASRTAVEA
jgi:hypothetical protein